jgi:hypothetical protein
MAQSQPIKFLSVQLPDGTWIAVELRPGQYATGQTKAEAMKRFRRSASNPEAALSEDEMDLAAIELHRHEPTVPLDRLLKKYRRQ